MQLPVSPLVRSTRHRNTCSSYLRQLPIEKTILIFSRRSYPEIKILIGKIFIVAIQQHQNFPLDQHRGRRDKVSRNNITEDVSFRNFLHQTFIKKILVVIPDKIPFAINVLRVRKYYSIV